MSILSSLLKLGQGAPTQQIPTAVQTTEIAKEVAPFIKDILGKGQALYKQRMDEGFVPFEGQTLADVSADQLAAQQGLRGLVGSQAGGLQEARDLTRAQTQQATAEQLQPFMNPYQQAVTDISKRTAQERFEQETLPGLRKQAIDAGAFGGSRAAMRESQAQDAQARLLADIQAKGDLAAFQDARKAFEDQKTRERFAAEGLEGLTGREFQARKEELAGLQAIGSEEQQRQQQLLDESYQRFLQERAFPEQQLGQYQGFVQGASPFLGTTSRTMGAQTFQDSPVEKALGLAGTTFGTVKKGLDLFSKEGGKVEDGKPGGGTGSEPGGLRSIMIKIIRAQRGKGGDPRSRRSEEIRTRKQQEDVTRMLEDMDMKAGGLIDLPVVQREEGQQVLNLRKPYDDPEFVSQGERIAEKIQNLPGAIKDFLGSILGPTERQQEQREELDQYVVEAPGRRNVIKSEREFDRSGEDDLDTFKRKQAIREEQRKEFDKGKFMFPFGEQFGLANQTLDSIPNQSEANQTNIVSGGETTGGETTGGDTTSDAPGVDKKGLPSMREALLKRRDLLSQYSKDLQDRKNKRIASIGENKKAALAQAQIDFLMGFGRGKRDPNDPSAFAGLKARGQAAVDATKDFNDKIAALNKEELDVLDANVQDSFNIASEELNLAFENNKITRQEFLDSLEERKVAAQEILSSIDRNRNSYAQVMEVLDDVTLGPDERKNRLDLLLDNKIITRQHYNEALGNPDQFKKQSTVTNTGGNNQGLSEEITVSNPKQSGN